MISYLASGQFLKLYAYILIDKGELVEPLCIIFTQIDHVSSWNESQLHKIRSNYSSQHIQRGISIFLLYLML